MARPSLSLLALGLLIAASTCRSLVGAAPPTPTPEPTFTPGPSPEPTFTLAPPEFEVLLWLGDGAPMVYVPTGDFTLGLDNPPNPAENASESPAHIVYLEAFWIDRYEVTNERFGRFIADGGYHTRQYWTNEGWQWVQANQINAPPYWGRPDFGLPQQPVVSVTWYEAYAYCLWAGKRLPTEAEWEKAARGDDACLYPWGNEWDCRRGNFDDESLNTPAANECAGGDGYQLTAPVGSYEAGQSPYHVHDMAGNVWEWTLSQPAPYPYAPNDGRNLPESGGSRVIRGASWRTFTGELDGDNHARVTFRADLPPSAQTDRVGLRCVAPAE
jgi:formylglycine-generating enzyme required for sulfatase activity